ncbi:MAG: beta-ketoacyl synthase chain length factor [Succinivibrio sp.]|nr:beta-ketoacyl synthase chain length factor [Succinivibrio sp.]
MKFSFDIKELSGRVAGVADEKAFIDWLSGTLTVPAEAKPCKTKFLPMMTARRMCIGSRFAADVALELIRSSPVQAAVFASRHGELERNFSIQSAIAEDGDVSPTDFAMSVHNAAAGSFSIVGKQQIPISSVSAGRATFPQALGSAVSLLKRYEQVLLVDFDSYIPDFFRQGMHESMPDLPYAVGLVLTRGSTVSCESRASEAEAAPAELPCSLALCKALYSGSSYSFEDGDNLWQFSYTQLRAEDQ